MKKILSFLFGVCVFISATAGDTYYVDSSVDSAAAEYAVGHDGSSREKAFATIQEGVDKAKSGDIVLVAPGDYTAGGKRDELNGGGHFNRVFINRKAIALKVDGPRASARIIGESHDGAVLGLGADAVRCVAVIADSASETPVIEGFAITSGASDAAENAKDRAGNIGGGVLVCTSSGSRSANAIVVDCDIIGCAATRGGGANGGRYVRCRFEECNATSYGAAARNVSLYNCLVVRNAGLKPAVEAVSYVLDNGVVVNCTFSGNAGRAMGDYPGTVKNCIFSVNGDVKFIADGTHNASYGYCLVDKNGGKLTDTCIKPEDNLQLFAPARGDYRPLPTSLAVGAGDVGALEMIPVEYRDKDFGGNPRMSGGKVNIGCYETPSPQPASGAAVFYFNAVVDGYTGYCSGLHAYSETYPVMFEVSCTPGAYANETMYLYCNIGEYGTNLRWYPKRDCGKFALMPPPSSSGGIARQGADQVLWVDGDYSLGGSDGSEEKPFADIQSAITAAGAKRTLVKVKPGTYSLPESEGAEQRNVVDIVSGKDVRIVGVEGAEKTTIAGASAVRCVFMGGASAVQGFTLSGGNAIEYSGGLYAADRLAVLTDCIITNCTARRASAAYRGRLERCWIADNYFSGSDIANNDIAEQGIYSSCVFSGNRAPDKLATHPVVGMIGWMYHCSGVGVGTCPITDSNVVQMNCIWDSYWICSDDKDDLSAGNYVVGLPIWNYTDDGRFVSTGFPLARSLPFCRSYAGSPAVVGGSANHADYFRYATFDFDGKVFTYPNGKPTAGAFQETFASVIASVSGTTGGGISLEGTNTVGLVAGETVIFEPTKLGRRPFVGMRVNGELITNVTSYAWTVPSQPCSSPLYVEAVYGTNWYVDVVNGNNDNNGSYPNVARKTLESVLTNAISGDVVTAAPGTYSEGSMLNAPILAGSSVLRSRAVVPAGVTLRSSDGAESTFIVGASASSPTDEFGNGSDAVRGVVLEADARLCGFTVTGGRTDYNAQNTAESDRNRGGGIYCATDDSSFVEDCVISNNAALRGGGGYKGTYLRCRITDNRATINGAAVRNAYLCDCFIDNNTGNGETVYIFWSFINCTFGAGNVSADGNEGLFGFNASRPPSSPVANSVVLRGKISGAVYVSNTVYAAGVGFATIGNKLGGTCVQVPAENLVFDADGRPVYGRCAAIDFGDASLRPAFADGYDVDGGQRIYNSAVDAGCCEFDWRGKFARSIGGVAAEAPFASPGVVMDEDGGDVVLSDGCRLQIELGNPGSRETKYETGWTITGEGVLSLLRNGELVESFTASDAGVYVFASCNPSEGMEFSFEGQGTARIRRCRAIRGMTLYVR